MEGNGASNSNIASSNLRAQAKEFVPQPQLSPGIAEISSATESLWQYPEDFFEISDALARQLNECITDNHSLTVAINALFEQCIYLQNFQNTGARLCYHLETHFKKNFSDNSETNFRNHLLTRCKEEFRNKEEHMKSEEGVSILIGFTVFMAEFANLTKVNNVIIPILAQKVTELLMALLKVQTNDAIKWIVNVLKLCGSELEQAQNVKFNQFFTEVKDFILNETEAAKVSRNQRLNLLNMIELRAAKWNTTEVEKLRADNSHRVDYNPYANMMVEPALSEDQTILYEDEDYYLACLGDGINTVTSAQASAAQYNTGDEGACGEGRDVFDVSDGLSNLEEVCDGSQSYVVEREDMDPEMTEAYETYLASMENLSTTSQNNS